MKTTNYETVLKSVREMVEGRWKRPERKMEVRSPKAEGPGGDSDLLTQLTGVIVRDPVGAALPKPVKIKVLVLPEAPRPVRPVREARTISATWDLHAINLPSRVCGRCGFLSQYCQCNL